jgi:alpha-L-fucosidase
LHAGDPDGTVWSPGMVDIPLRGANGIHNWFWHPGQDHGVYEKDDLLRIYQQSVGRNCNLVIGAVITPEGLVPEHDIRRLTEFGNAINGQFTAPVARMNGGSGNVHEIALEVSSRISAAVIQEDITFGERIRTYKLEGRTKAGKWFVITAGGSIGHKRIERFPAQELTGMRLKITNARATPKLKEFAVFNTV